MIDLVNRPKILKDDKLEAELTEKGYVIVPFFDQAEIERLTRYFHEKLCDDPNRIYALSHSEDVDMKYRTNQWIMDNYREKVGHYFHNSRILGGTYVAKPPGGKGLIHPHQDWTLVDERRFRSCNVWVPLIDTNEKNGAIRTLNGYHNTFMSFRGPTLPNLVEGVREHIWEVSEQINMKAGHAYLYDHRLIHCSNHNFSDDWRIATACAVTSEDADLRFYYHHKDKPNGQCVEEFEGSGDFLLSNDRFDHPKTLKSLGMLDYSVEPYTKEMFPISQPVA